jgi:hypothetical protein
MFDRVASVHRTYRKQRSWRSAPKAHRPCSRGEASASRRLVRPQSRLIRVSDTLTEMGYLKQNEAASCHPPE